MRKLLLILCIGLLLMNCNSNAIEKPKNLLTKDQMVDVLYDLYVINAMKSSNMQYLEDHNITPSSYVLEKYKVDSLQFTQSDRYYASDVEEYEKIYQRVTQKLQENKAVIDSIIAKNPEPEVKKLERKTPIIQPKVIDSLREKRALGKQLLKGDVRN